MNTWGENLKISIFGESHGGGIGIIIDGLPSGIKPDLDFVNSRMNRRRPGKNKMSTPRNEKDEVEILSGLFNGRTTGTPLCGIIRNSDTHSSDYTPSILRPSHADYTAYVKYGESRDYRGGGHFSGRITAPLVFAGAVAQQILTDRGITVGTHIAAIGNIKDNLYDPVSVTSEILNHMENSDFPVLNPECRSAMQNKIEEARKNADSVGGVLECGICGLDVGCGSPFFGSFESRMSAMMFSVPAVKGIEFGAGFGLAEMYGSAANDSFCINNGKISTVTNNNGGINGGITNGMPVIFRLAVKPTPSIGKPQNTVDIEKKENTVTQIKGRHDPCIVHRAAPVVTAAAAIAVLDMLMD